MASRRRDQPRRHQVGVTAHAHGLEGRDLLGVSLDAQFRRQRRQCVGAGLQEGRPEQQVFGRVAGERQFGRNHDRGALRLRLAHRLRERIGAVVAVRNDADFHARILTEHRLAHRAEQAVAA